MLNSSPNKRGSCTEIHKNCFRLPVLSNAENRIEKQLLYEKLHHFEVSYVLSSSLWKDFLCKSMWKSLKMNQLCCNGSISANIQYFWVLLLVVEVHRTSAHFRVEKDSCNAFVGRQQNKNRPHAKKFISFWVLNWLYDFRTKTKIKNLKRLRPSIHV